MVWSGIGIVGMCSGKGGIGGGGAGIIFCGNFVGNMYMATNI